MDSLNNLKGYNKVVDHHHPPPPRHHLKTIAISLALLLSTVAIGLILIGGLIPTAKKSPSRSLPIDSIRAVCSVTLCPDSCFSAVSNNYSLPKPDPELIIALFLKLAINELRNISNTATSPALKDCGELFDDALSRLGESVNVTEEVMGPMLNEGKVASDLNTWISAAMSDQETCVDGLEEMGESSTVVDEVRSKVQRSKVYMSNSLAILSNIHLLHKKFGLTMH